MVATACVCDAHRMFDERHVIRSHTLSLLCAHWTCGSSTMLHVCAPECSTPDRTFHLLQKRRWPVLREVCNAREVQYCAGCSHDNQHGQGSGLLPSISLDMQAQEQGK